MKLRNKKTGEIVTFVTIEEIYDGLDFTYIKKSGNENELSYSSLKKFNEEWEDYTPTEPLIKDEKVRKAVRAWADADGADEKIYLTIDENGSRFGNKYGGYIEFAFRIDMEERLYTIAELCGKEEE